MGPGQLTLPWLACLRQAPTESFPRRGGWRGPSVDGGRRCERDSGIRVKLAVAFWGFFSLFLILGQPHIQYLPVITTETPISPLSQQNHTTTITPTPLLPHRHQCRSPTSIATHPIITTTYHSTDTAHAQFFTNNIRIVILPLAPSQ